MEVLGVRVCAGAFWVQVRVLATGLVSAVSKVAVMVLLPMTPRCDVTAVAAMSLVWGERETSSS